MTVNDASWKSSQFVNALLMARLWRNCTFAIVVVDDHRDSRRCHRSQKKNVIFSGEKTNEGDEEGTDDSVAATHCAPCFNIYYLRNSK